MKVMQVEQIARKSLQADAAYCAIAGGLVWATRIRLGRVLGVPSSAVALAGIATVGWSAVVYRLSRREDWEPATGLVAAVNAVAATGLLVSGILHPRRPARWFLVGLGVDVALFSGIQSVTVQSASSAK